jgi:hypothetical protein
MSTSPGPDLRACWRRLLAGDNGTASPSLWVAGSGGSGLHRRERRVFSPRTRRLMVSSKKDQIGSTISGRSSQSDLRSRGHRKGPSTAHYAPRPAGSVVRLYYAADRSRVAKIQTILAHAIVLAAKTSCWPCGLRRDSALQGFSKERVNAMGFRRKCGMQITSQSGEPSRQEILDDLLHKVRESTQDGKSAPSAVISGVAGAGRPLGPVAAGGTRRTL